MIIFKNMRMGSVSPMGVTIVDGGINIAVSVDRNIVHEFGIVFYENGKEVLRLAFPQNCRIGNMFAVRMDGEVNQNISYLFYCDGQLIMDPYAKLIHGREKWNDTSKEENSVRAGIMNKYDEVEWLNDRPLQIPYEKSIFYSLHVRGFTKHSSSQVEHKGTFEGIAEKVEYLKELGITGVVAMPIYDFDEVIVNPAYQEIDPMLSPYYSECKDVWQYRTNYWGYAETGNFYFAPKFSYSAKKDPASSLKELVRILHKNGIELMLQMYFSPSLAPDFVRDVLRFWVLEYHIDGFQLMGAKLPMELLGKDQLLGRTKLIAENNCANEIYKSTSNLFYRNLASYQDGFRYDSRKFLKGDSDLVYVMSEHMRKNNECEAVVNHITDYRGFTLMDLVSYDRKHNEENGENNRDGSDYNYSWNCGAEGPSKKKSINQLRLSQRKNAMAMLLLAQGTPLILSGDECGHSTLGNNNAYCQDNKTNYINWKRNQTEEEFFDFVKKLICYRKEHGILHSAKLMRMTDSLSCGYPDLSYHGEQAWQVQFENYNHHLGMMYCSYYENEEYKPGQKHSQDGDFVYLAFNMHWIEHTFSLPLLPVGYKWELSLYSKNEIKLDGLEDDTILESKAGQTKNQKEQKNVKKEIRNRTERVLIPPRSIAVLTGRKQ